MLWFIVVASCLFLGLVAVLLARRSSSGLQGRTREEQQAMLQADLEARRRGNGAAGDGRLGERA